MSLELVLLHNQKNGTESFQVIGTEKRIRKRIKHVHRFPVRLSPFLSHKSPLSPKRSRKLTTPSRDKASRLLWPTPFPGGWKGQELASRLARGRSPAAVGAGRWSGKGGKILRATLRQEELG